MQEEDRIVEGEMQTKLEMLAYPVSAFWLPIHTRRSLIFRHEWANPAWRTPEVSDFLFQR